MPDLTLVSAHGAGLPSLWDSLEQHGVPREHRTAACAAFAVWLDKHTAATKQATRALEDQPIDLWPAS